MDGQLSFASLDFAGKKKRTKRDVFLAEMAAVVPWSVLESLIEPHYPKVGPQGGRRPFPIAVMLRIYCLQLEARGALLRGGTIVDATLIAASPSTKNAAGQRDPEMRSSKKGNQWYIGMKAHIGVDARSGLVHTVGVTSGSVHDATVMEHLIRDDDTAVYGDKGYASGARKCAAEAAGVLWAVKEKGTSGRRLTVRQRTRNRRFGKVRAKVEHVFRLMKCQFGYRKVRYRGLTKNAAQVFSLLALANLYLARRSIASA